MTTSQPDRHIPVWATFVSGIKPKTEPAAMPRGARHTKAQAGSSPPPGAICVSFFAALGMAVAAAAHPLAPALLDIEELDTGRLAVTWKTSALRAPGADVRPALPPSCQTGTPVEVAQDGDSVTLRWVAECADAPLVGQRFGVEGLGAAKIDALLRVRLTDGRVVQHGLRAAAPSVVVPERPRRLDVVASYARLGSGHILTGPDHLLFVIGLLLLCATTRLLVETITAFTVGHSITLSLAVLDIARVPTGPTEALIAASVLVLAAELAREVPAPTLMRRFPWAMALVFGLLHGLGFAGALREIGLPSGEIPLALFAFNAGIEIGQLAVVGAVLGARRVLAGLPWRPPRWAGWLPAYVMGSLAALWCLQRAADLMR